MSDTVTAPSAGATSLDPRSIFVAEWRKLVDRTGKNQAEVAKLLHISDSQMSRYASGQNLPKEKTLRALCEIIGDVTFKEQQRMLVLLAQARSSLSGKKQRGAGPSKDGRRREGRDRGGNLAAAARVFLAQWLRSRAVIAVACVVGTAAVVVLLMGPGARTVTGDVDTGSTGGSGAGQGADGCDRYAVAAADLWLRDDHGSPQIEIGHDQQVTVDDRRNPSNLPYWHVKADNGQRGWADYRYLRALCK